MHVCILCIDTPVLYIAVASYIAIHFDFFVFLLYCKD